MTELLPGTQVLARGLRWEVVSSQPAGDQRLYRLRGLDGAFRGAEVDLLSPFETLAPLTREIDPTRAAPPGAWLVYHQAFLLEQSLGAGVLLSAQPGRLRLEPYQLVPVVRALRMGRVRLLLADGVGLGKTVQAGLVVCELMARRLAHRVLVVSPAGPLLTQWQDEFRERFGMKLEIVDRARLEEIRRANELGTNPFDHLPLALASIDFLKQERVVEQLERASYDVVVVDEAHHCFDLGAAGEREDSQRRKLALVLARRSDALILATATPHDGNDRSFASLVELLDPSLVDGRGALRGDRYKAHVVRRLKRHVRDPRTGEALFPERRVEPRPVSFSAATHPAVAALHAGLLELVSPELRRALRTREYGDFLAFFALLKRSVSTVAACRATLGAIAERFDRALAERAEADDARRQRLRALRDLHVRLGRFGAVSPEEEREREDLEAEDVARRLAALEREARRETREKGREAGLRERLGALIETADRALGEEDPKLAALAAEVREVREREPRANVLVYTEYTDSQAALVAALAAAGIGNVLSLSGEDDEARRKAVVARFCREDGLILVSTDASAEGLNLHARCHRLLHLELPFNPNRLEQRNGRIDRFGQRLAPEVRYFFLRRTFEQNVFLRLVAKYERQRARLTLVPDTLGVSAARDAVARGLIEGLLASETRHAAPTERFLFDLSAPDDPSAEEAAVRDLLEEIDRSFRGFERAAKTYAWLGEQGLNAEARLADEAERARAAGNDSVAVPLETFVQDAVRLDGGGASANGTIELTLPPAWCHGLDDLPGFDPERRRVRLTTDLDRTADADGRPIGFLGRSHPLVRRALERVRRLSLGGDPGRRDARASGIRAPAASAAEEIIFTFLGRVSTGTGPALEQVLAVRVPRAGEPEPLDAPSRWLGLVQAGAGLLSTDLWERSFKPWGPEAGARARAAAEAAFGPVARGFAEEHRREVESERVRLREWVEQRSREVTGEASSRHVTRGLFDGLDAPDLGPVPAWAPLEHGEARLAAYAQDRAEPGARRSEADGVLSLYRRRTADLDRRARVGAPEVEPLGLLMVVPAGAAER